jgi:tetratricopeptide (TPR) repeat protein
LDLQRRALEADALSAVDAVSRHKEALEAFVAWLDHPDAFAHLNDDPCTLQAASDALRCDLVGYQGFLALQHLDSDRDRCAGHVRLFLDSPLSRSTVDERREALLERVLEGLSTGDRMRRRLETIQYADPENEAVRVRLKAVRANRTARSEAVTSGHRTLDEARRLHEAGTLEEAETLLDNLFEQSGRSDPVLAREAINLLNAVRRERDEAQKDACLKHLKKTLELGRSREVLESTGGRTPLPSLEPALVLLRIRALTRLGYIDRSAFEFKQLGRDRILPADLLAERDDLEIEVALLDPKRRLREEWTDALQMWHRREDERLIMSLADFEGRYPGEPGIPFLGSLALHRLGREAEAREQSEEAVRRARHGTPSFLTAMILRLRDRAVEPHS